MAPVLKSPLNIGRHMPRSRHQRGRVEERGKRVRKWIGHYYVYEMNEAGKEERKHKAEILGLKADMKKWQAYEKLVEIIRRAEATPRPNVPQSSQTLEWFWTARYLPMKEKVWRPATRSVVASVMTAHVIPRLGAKCLSELSRFDLQMHLNSIDPKYSGSMVRKVRTWVKAILDEAAAQGFVEKNPAQKLDLPETRESSTRFLSLQEVGRLLSATAGRDHLIVRMFIECGLRPGELFAARWGALNGSQLLIKEAISKAARGRAIGKTKTPASKSAISLPSAVVRLLGEWRQTQEKAHRLAPSDESFIFASGRGTPISSANYLNRFLKPLGEKLDIAGINYQVFRRTCSTHFQRHATIKETQAQLRHADAATTLGIYTQTLPEGLAAAVESLDQEFTAASKANEPNFEM